jgi:O-antigen ligase
MFLRKKVHYYLTLSVIATTLFSWFNLNSYLIILLLLCRLVDGGPRKALRNAFSNRYFLAYLSIFLLEFAGLFYTHHLFAGWKQMESKATLVAIPFILCAGPFTDRAGYRRLLSAYCVLLAAICIYCLVMAGVEYHWQQDTNVFFYHQLTSAISVNAVFFSGYVLVAILFLVFSSFSLAEAFSPKVARGLNIALIVFFIGMMVLLSSRLLLVLLILIFIVYLAARWRPITKRTQILSLGLLIVLGTGLLAFTDNPVSRRCKELEPARLKSDLQAQRHTSASLDGVTFRLLLWGFAFDILNERHAWVFGVSAGDSQELLDQKYLTAGMSQGYLGYNFHNEYIEVLVRSGLVGWAIFMLVAASLIGLARWANPEGRFTVVLILLLFLTESTLEMQHTLFLSSFFPLLVLSRRPAANRRIVVSRRPAANCRPPERT